eukprot:XP_016658655.1 PREDICTED: uncharacterized protein LOC107883349 [Acyrthosiphon pisum]
MSPDVNKLDIFDLGNLDSGPVQPILKVYPKTAFGSQNRSFGSKYFKEYNWLEYSIEKDAIFCFPCRMFSTSSGHVEDVFVTTGFNNWKKASLTILNTLIYKLH